MMSWHFIGPSPEAVKALLVDGRGSPHARVMTGTKYITHYFIMAMMKCRVGNDFDMLQHDVMTALCPALYSLVAYCLISKRNEAGSD